MRSIFLFESKIELLLANISQLTEQILHKKNILQFVDNFKLILELHLDRKMN